MKLIIQNKLDKRVFRGGKLKNGIKYVLIQDELLTSSYVSVSVNVGSYNNPHNYDGLAHFLEHMLFMGSKKYPDENHFYDKLTKYGGSSNAYTDDLHTVYYFNVYDDGLLEMIDIFSRFFIDPLFNKDSLNREINAVHSEYDKNLNNDNYAINQFIHYLIDKKLTINNFFCGNIDTLNKPELRDVMIDFYNKYYVSHNISISIMSKYSIEILYNIINTTFNNIPNKKYDNITFNKPLFNNINKTFHFKSITDIYKIIYIWEIPNNIYFINSKDFSIFGNILSSISHKSLYYYLKNIGYINNIDFSINHVGFFMVEINLTIDGFNKLEFIEYILFLTISQIIDSDINKYASYFKNISKINYNCLTKESPDDLCNVLAVKHFSLNTKYIYKLLYTIKKIKNTQDYNKLYKKYIKSNNFIRIIISNNYIYDKKYYNTLYQYINNSYCIIRNYKPVNYNININFIFNIDNNFLDINIKLEKKLNKYNIPVLLKNNIWYGGNSSFNEPIIFTNLLLYNNNFYCSPLNYILTELSCIIINHMISSYLYNALDIGYNVNFNSSYYHEYINISINGPNNVDKLKIIINDITLFLKNINYYFIKLSKLYINNLLISFKLNYNNLLLSNPWELSSILLQSYIFPTSYDINILLDTLKTIDYNIIQNYINTLFNEAYIINFIYGNIHHNKINNLMNDIINTISPCDYKPFKCNKIISKTFINPNKIEKSNCITYYYYVGKFSPNLLCKIKLFIYIYQQLFFDELRTKYQLGYLVLMSYINIKQEYYIIQKIQSKKNYDDVSLKIDNFNNNLLNILSEKLFDNAKNILTNELSSPENKLVDLYSLYLNEISNQYYIFNRKQILLDELDKIDINDIILFIKNLNNPSIIYISKKID